ncbi:MAG: biotin-dependent carboxyltransferase family protein [Mycobacteriales bacterium]
MIEILAPGPLCTVQDLGRPGLGALGVGRSGAADRAALRLANRLVGNPEGAAGLEITFGGLSARFEHAATVALTGAQCPVQVGPSAGFMSGPLGMAAGAELRLGLPAAGVRTYLAVRGGIDVPAVLGSCSTDLLSGLGPPVLAAGTRLAVGSASGELPEVDLAPVPAYHDEVTLRARRGPRDDWFSAEAGRLLASSAYVVTAESNRIGVRLSGPALERSRPGELPSEGMVAGALQVPPNGAPVLFLADHPVTGGYPVIAVVDGEDLGLAAQARPGDRIRFRLAPVAAEIR